MSCLAHVGPMVYFSAQLHDGLVPTSRRSSLIYGDDYFGKVDHVPGLFFVKTRFLHCMWVPLVPRESYLMVDDGACPPIQIRLRTTDVLDAGTWIVGSSVLEFLFVTIFAFRFGLIIGASSWIIRRPKWGNDNCSRPQRSEKVL